MELPLLEPLTRRIAPTAAYHLARSTDTDYQLVNLWLHARCIPSAPTTLEEVLETGDSALVFTQFTEIGSALEKYLVRTRHYPTSYLHGGTSVAKREQLVDAFQDPEREPSVFILSLRAGGVGLNLTRASHVFHFDRWWNPAVEDQATDRAFRIGQHKNVFVHKFVATGTLEERIDQLIEDKKRLSSIIIGSDESWLTELDNDTFKRLIALQRSAVVE